jgi:hypothetical protein
LDRVAGRKKLRAFRARFWRNSNADPWISFVPDLVATLRFTPPPPEVSAR